MSVTALTIPHTHVESRDLVPSCRNDFSHPLPVSVLAECTWKALAPLMAARATMFLWSPQTRFKDSADLSKKLPDRPAAVPTTRRGRTKLIPLDLDSKKFGAEAVVADLAFILALLKSVGIRAVVDLSTSGGAHVLIPLKVTVTLDELRPLLNALAQRCRTLDLSPAINDSHRGCITVPGSRTREGGFRVLQGSLAGAVNVFLDPNEPHTLEALAADLGVTEFLAAAYLPADSLIFDDAVGAEGFQAQLNVEHRTDRDYPDPVLQFATTGALPADRRWPSTSEARQSVLVHAMWRGMSAAEVLQTMAQGQPWFRGLGRAYRRYGRGLKTAFLRDWAKAHRWHQVRVSAFHSVAHRTEHTGGQHNPACTRWLHHALWWCDTTLRSSALRWSVAAVLQAMAVQAARKGELAKGVPVVSVGGRSLSLGAGLLSKETVWGVLRFLRETVGSPVLLTQEASGLLPDVYALVTPDVQAPEPTDTPPAGAAAPAEVHMAWWIIGLAHRRVYETVTVDGVHSVRDIAAAARMSLSATYESVAELCRVGLLVKEARNLVQGKVTLQDVADQYRLHEERARRIADYRMDRDLWRSWLADEPTSAAPHEVRPVQVRYGWVWLPPAEEQDYLEAVMATGPPVHPEDKVVLPIPTSRQWCRARVQHPPRGVPR